MIHPTNPGAVRVKRDGERGWHWVARFDPAIHELYDAPAGDAIVVSGGGSGPAPRKPRKAKP